MNVLLAEANVPYDKLKDMEEKASLGKLVSEMKNA
jgi:NAD/NADP transhydrogenase beta subunit